MGHSTYLVVGREGRGESTTYHRVLLTMRSPPPVVVPLARTPSRCLTRSCWFAVCRQKHTTQVNYVNAVSLAKETGLAIEVAFSERDPKGYTNGLTVEFEIDGVLNGRRTMTGKTLARLAPVWEGTHYSCGSSSFCARGRSCVRTRLFRR